MLFRSRVFSSLKYYWNSLQFLGTACCAVP